MIVLRRVRSIGDERGGNRKGEGEGPERGSRGTGGDALKRASGEARTWKSDCHGSGAARVWWMRRRKTRRRRRRRKDYSEANAVNEEEEEESRR